MIQFYIEKKTELQISYVSAVMYSYLKKMQL